ncbi:MAG TPA: acyl-ACP desaturase [Acidimicrobiales bacterium]
MTAAMPPDALLRELEPTVGSLLERHLRASKEWFPHEHVPYSRGRDHEEGHRWTPADSDLGGYEISDAVRSALYVNLLTEDNLPYYSRDIDHLFGRDGAWGEWVRRWTAEEARHSMVIYGYIATTRAIDLVALERGRMAQVSSGQVPAPDNPQQGFAYVAMQELATRISHRNTGRLLGDPVGYDLMMRVAADENLHHLFYRDLASAALELDPSNMVMAIEHEVRTFAMPGLGIPDFDRHAAAIARAGIYDLLIHHEQILVPVVLRHWAVESLTGLTPEAERARDQLLNRIEKSGKVARRLAERRTDSAPQPASVS